MDKLAAKKNLSVNVTDDGIAIVKLDQADSKVNTLNTNLSDEMGALLNQLV